MFPPFSVYAEVSILVRHEPAPRSLPSVVLARVMTCVTTTLSFRLSDDCPSSLRAQNRGRGGGSLRRGPFRWPLWWCRSAGPASHTERRRAHYAHELRDYVNGAWACAGRNAAAQIRGGLHTVVYQHALPPSQVLGTLRLSPSPRLILYTSSRINAIGPTD